MIDCVVGSGPAGVACAEALLQRGRSVLMLDAGTRLEPERAEIVERLACSSPDQWSTEDREWLRSGMAPDASGVSEKLLFGSNFPYRGVQEHLGITMEGVGLPASLARGGLSTVWGSAMLPYKVSEIPDWPISLTQLAPHYRAVLEFISLSATNDLTDWFPLHTDSVGQLAMSRQATRLWGRLEKHREHFRDNGIYAGRARVAIQTANAPGKAGCVYCGMCMYGCPYGYIYSSAHTLKKMEGADRFTYQGDSIVETVAETTAGVVITGHHRLTRKPLELRAARVFLASGAVPTTGILLRSRKVFDRPVRMKDSQYFMLPLLLTKHIGKVREEKLHGMSQIFLEVLDPAISPYIAHLQVYSYSDLIGKAVEKSFGPLRAPLQPFVREFENRLLFVQGFMHSRDSSEIDVILRAPAAGAKERLELKAVINPQARKTVDQVVLKLMKNSLRLGAVPVPPLMHFGAPGRGFHAGGTFPMREKPATEFETDVLGRPAGWKRIHAVDATVFPSISGTTITFTSMANAHRIATEATDSI